MISEPLIKVSFNSPLKEKDTLEQTVGCRHTNPDICGSAYIESVCAFSRSDRMCLRPSRAWKKQYKRLLEGREVGI